MESEDYSGAEDADPYTTTKRGRSDRKRRFSEEQIKSLESMFESQAKLEPRKKLQLARELGLQPRQVAIWFQNKRARWKSKQLERQYAALRTDYETLLSSFECLKKEKQLLLKQLQKLAELLKRPPDGSSNDGDSDNGDGKGKEDREDARPGMLLTGEGSDPSAILYSDEEDKKLCYVSQDEADLLYFGEPACSAGGSTSTQRRSCFGGSCSPEKCSSTIPQWWEFWPMTD